MSGPSLKLLPRLALGDSLQGAVLILEPSHSVQNPGYSLSRTQGAAQVAWCHDRPLYCKMWGSEAGGADLGEDWLGSFLVEGCHRQACRQAAQGWHGDGCAELARELECHPENGWNTGPGGCGIHCTAVVWRARPGCAASDPRC